MSAITILMLSVFIGAVTSVITVVDGVVCPSDNPTGYAIHLPHPTDCTKFFICVWETPVERDCPLGLHFNPQLTVCDFPASAKCRPRPVNLKTILQDVVNGQIEVQGKVQ